jgi:Ser/Thr protein kinase RdoA (MazF antagonist)
VTVASIDPHAILAEYDLGAVYQVTETGGTAGKTWKVSTSRGDYFLRLRGVRTSSEARLQFDHGLREHLVAHGVPTATAIRTMRGEQWLSRQGPVYELYPFVVGRPFCSHHEYEIVNAARALARYHQVAARYESPSTDREPIAQYTTLGFSDEVSDRMDDPHLQAVQLRAIRRKVTRTDDRRVVDWAVARVEKLQQAYAGEVYERLDGWVIHGDYTPANLLFSERGEVSGIFDLDWALPGARCRDVADGLYFFATRPREIDSGDIWSLTDAAEFDAERCRAFLRAYHETAPLTTHEIEAIPLAFAGRWLSIRLEGMAKLREHERFRFFSRDVARPLLWLDTHWSTLREDLLAR